MKSKLDSSSLIGLKRATFKKYQIKNWFFLKKD